MKITSMKELSILIFDDIRVELNVNFIFYFKCKNEFIAISYNKNFFSLFYNMLEKETDVLLWKQSYIINRNTDIYKTRFPFPWEIVDYDTIKGTYDNTIT